MLIRKNKRKSHLLLGKVFTKVDTCLFRSAGLLHSFWEGDHDTQQGCSWLQVTAEVWNASSCIRISSKIFHSVRDTFFVLWVPLGPDSLFKLVFQGPLLG